MQAEWKAYMELVRTSQALLKEMVFTVVMKVRPLVSLITQVRFLLSYSCNERQYAYR